MSKRGPEQEREEDPKRPRVDGMVQIPTQLMDAMIPYLSRFPDELWQQLLVRLPQESVDNIHADIKRLNPNHFMRKKFEEKDRLEVDDFFDNLAPTGAVLSEDADTLTLTLSENFRSIFKKPLEEKIVLQRSNKSIDDEPNGRISSQKPKPLSFIGYGPYLRFYFMKVDQGYSDHFKRLVEYAKTYLYVHEELFSYLETGFTGQSGSIMDGIRFQFQIAGGTVVVIINVKTSRYEGHDNQLIVYFVPMHPDKRPWMPTLPTHELAKNYLDLVMKRLQRRDAWYGNRERELRRKFKFTVQPPLEYYQFPDAPLMGQRWIVKLNGFGSIFEPPLSQIEGRFLHEPNVDGAATFEAQNLPPNLKLNPKNYDQVQQLLENNMGLKMTPLEEFRNGNTFYIDNLDDREGDLEGTFIDLDQGYDIEYLLFHMIRGSVDTDPDLKALWHYTQPPRQGRTVNMAAVRRKDLLGLD